MNSNNNENAQLRLTDRGVIKELMEKNGFTFSKALGQNFIVNPSVCPKIASMGGAEPGRGVIEIGAGIGVLTAELASRAEKVVCIEIDSRLLPILDTTLARFNNIKIVNSDVLKVDLKKLISDEFSGMEVVVCANLPYYITSPILMYLLEQRLPVKSVTVMVQKEAAQRICSAPGTRECGAISAAIHYFSEPRLLFQVARGSFMPSPDVDSAVIRLDIRDTPPVDVQNEELFFKIIKGAFSQRRKTVLNTLSSSLSLPKEKIKSLLAAVGIDEKARAENLTLKNFAAFTKEYEALLAEE